MGGGIVGNICFSIIYYVNIMNLIVNFLIVEIICFEIFFSSEINVWSEFIWFLI